MVPFGNTEVIRTDGTELVGDDPTVVASTSRAGSADIVPRDYTYETQRIIVQADSALSGSFNVTFEGHEVTLNVADTAAQLKASLEAASTIHSVNVFTLSDSSQELVISIQFTHLSHERVQGAGNVALFLVSDTSALGGTNAAVTVRQFVQGTAALRITLSGLEAGQDYYARVQAFTDGGALGAYSNVASNFPRGQPDAPSNVNVALVDLGNGSYSATQLEVSWDAPASTGGTAVEQYHVEWYTGAYTSEQQRVTMVAEGGTNEVQAVEITATATDFFGSVSYTHLTLPTNREV